jgi:hypothetical protein
MLSLFSMASLCNDPIDPLWSKSFKERQGWATKKPCFREGETGFSEVESHGRSSFEKGFMPSPGPPPRRTFTQGTAP